MNLFYVILVVFVFVLLFQSLHAMFCSCFNAVIVYGHFGGVCKIRVGVISNTNLYSYGGHRISNTEIALKSDIIAKLTSMCNFSSLLMFSYLAKLQKH